MKYLQCAARLISMATVFMTLTIGGVAQATSYELNAIDSGWWNSDGGHISTNSNYIAGRIGSLEYRNFFVFDLSGVSGTVTSASLQLFNPSTGYVSPDANEMYTLYDVSTSITALTTGGSGQTAIFTDLGTGTTYGSVSVSSGDNGQLVEITLNGNGLAALNGATGSFAIGGALTSLSGSSTQHVFGWTHLGNPTKKLFLETGELSQTQPVPEPSTLVLVGSGLGLCFLSGYRKRQA